MALGVRRTTRWQRPEAVAIHSPKKKSGSPKAAKGAASGETLAAAELLSDYLDTRVSVQGVGGKGKIVIEFAGREDLQRIVDLIEGK